MRSKFDFYILLSTIYFSVPVGFVVFKIKFIFFFEFSPISLITFFSKECFRSSHVSFLFAGILDTTIRFRRNTDVIGRARQIVYQATLTACHWYFGLPGVLIPGLTLCSSRFQLFFPISSPLTVMISPSLLTR